MGDGTAMRARRLGARARFLPAGDTAFAVEFGERIDPEINSLVHRTAALLAAAPPEGLVETVPSFRSLLVHYDPLTTNAETLQKLIGELELDAATSAGAGRIWRIPALYGGAGGADLAEVAAATGLSEAEVIALHAGTLYRVYAQGFLPGFAYLGELPASLDLPRRINPRVRVPAGSVAIAQRMTGIYPVESPGGWHLIGHTPLRFFDPGKAPPTLFAPGDRVRFVPVDAGAHAVIAEAVARGSYVPETEGLST